MTKLINISSEEMFLSEHDLFKKTIEEILDQEFLIQFQSKETRTAYRRDILSFFTGINVINLENIALIPFPEMVNYVTRYIYSFKKTALKDENRILNAKTINRKAYSLSSFFKFLIEVYSYRKNPVARFKSEEESRNSTTESLTRGEMQDILQYLKLKMRKSKAGYRNYLIICFMFALALRRVEVSKLQWEDIRTTLTGMLSIDVYQKGRSIKKLPIPPALAILLMEYKDIYGTDSSYIFTPVMNNSTKDTTKPLSTTQINRIVTDTVKAVIPEKNITPHSFRKTFIELALSNNVPVHEIANGTGHASIEMIKYYDTRSTLENNAVNVVSNGML